MRNHFRLFIYSFPSQEIILSRFFFGEIFCVLHVLYISIFFNYFNGICTKLRVTLIKLSDNVKSEIGSTNWERVTL